MRIFLLLILHVIFLSASTPQEIRSLAFSKGLKPIPTDYKLLRSIVDDSKNPMTIEKIKLGKKLFFDKNLSKSRKIACAKCHNITKGGEDGLPTAIGHNGLENPSHLNSPTVLNSAFSKHLFWDGHSPSLRKQAEGPSQAPFEMASTPALIEERIKEDLKYERLFLDAYGTDDSMTFENVTKAIAVYEKTLVTRGAFDDFLDGNDSAMSKEAQHGLELFVDLGCKGCHFGHGVGGQKIQKFPLRDYNAIIDLTSVYDDTTKKRYVTDFSFNFKPYHPYPFENIGGFMGANGTQNFRVPILRNITQTAPYYHNGVIKDLRKAIFLMGRYQIGVDLSERQIDAIEAFFKTLEGDVVDFGLE
ncbi:MAG: cytochrome c peroxidase [Campylobacterota bacterium]|nr:cytochrome c peroxidase [Campylobacterota bacterium]